MESQVGLVIRNSVIRNQYCLPVKRETEVRWDDFIQQYQALWISISFGVVRDRELARDVVQESLRRVFAATQDRHLAFESKEHARNYVVRTVINCSKDTMRRQSRRAALEKTEMPIKSGPENRLLDREREAQMADRLQALRTAMKRLPKKLRDVVKLRFKERLTLAEISKRLDVPLTTVQYREKAALAQLKNAVQRSINNE